ncbi:chemotaxis protein CheD [Paucibacter sp. B2R-40]|uniref:chemotaxis protein CheD n=1 Tax=Paucibacter sp. B2R-40 TaxID=2893554 RepID=UPI0021E499F3|nr:chemotaxis protein CheD [Paucibacter sp. B2R-40]MCV2356224.1 chemotaxis protein CheD [Paucibacter sp. B2R-40]
MHKHKHPQSTAANLPPTRTAPPARPAVSAFSALSASPQIINLMPGQWHFGQAATLKTLLGSCVAITLWHPVKRFGGMCHYLLPSRASRGQGALDGRYGDEAVALLLQSIARTGTKPTDYIAHLYGGADTMPDGMNVKFNVGERNIEQGWALIDSNGFQLKDVDVGDNVPRTVVIDLASGRVEVKRSQAPGTLGTLGARK